MKEITLTHTFQLAQLDELDAADRELVEQAMKATESSYSPYSNFKVGAALRLSNGRIFCGSNQENAAYTNGICAERCTIFAAQAACPESGIETLAVAAYTAGSFTDNPIAPCGSCRQVIAEMEQRYGHPIRVLLYGAKGTYILPNGVEILMPITFQNDFLDM